MDGDTIRIGGKEADFYNISYDPGKKTWTYDEYREEQAEKAFLMYLFWSRPASEREAYMKKALSHGVEEMEEMRHWNPEIGRERRLRFLSNMETFFLENEFDQDQDERLYSARLREGSVTRADVAVARYLSFLRAEEASYGNQEESALAFEGSEWYATDMFLDRWQPYSQNGFRPEDNAFLLPEYKTNGIIEAFPEDEDSEQGEY